MSSPSEWPIVTHDDDGIRPAGPHDACLYCSRKIGQQHGSDCVMVKKLVSVELTFTITKSVPHGWDESQVNFHLNEGSSCSTNWLQDIENAVSRDGEDDVGCLCGGAVGRFIEVVDDAPRRGNWRGGEWTDE